MSSSTANSRFPLATRNPSHISNNGEDGTCFCGFQRLERVSWTFDEPGRRFWNCPNSMTKRPKCKYFDGKDLKLYEDCYKELLLTMKAEVDRKENRSDCTFLRRKVQELELLQAHEKVLYDKDLLELKTVNDGLKVKNARLKKENSSLKKKIGWLTTTIILLVLVVGFVIAILG